LSHIPLRNEKDCLNCGTIVEDRYCPHCGQENVVPKETFWHMVFHFFNDITHFDSSFFSTVRELVVRPGKLSADYMAGKRARYLHPIRMYVFSSALFFLLFFSVFKSISINSRYDVPLNPEERKAYIQRLEKRLVADSQNLSLQRLLAQALDSSQVLTPRDIEEYDGSVSMISFTGRNYKSLAEYDSIQAATPPEDQDSWFERKLVKRQIRLNEKYTAGEASEKFTKSVLHSLPYMLFLSLPLFALILKFVYFRRRKQFYYADHGVFTIHLYIFTFLLLILVFTLDRLDDLFQQDLFTWVIVLLFIGLLVYLYKAMRRFYGQGRWKTFLKFLIVSIVSLVMMVILFLGLFFFTAVTF
jgi:hypothetical protein